MILPRPGRARDPAPRRQDLRVVPSTAGENGKGVVRNVPGNVFDKHASRNPLVKVLMSRFHGRLLSIVDEGPHSTILDVGCGEGRTTKILATRLDATVVGIDLEPSVVLKATAEAASGHFLVGSGYRLPFDDGAFDTVVATEMLEHLDAPATALEEMARVARSRVVLTVPHEPWFRMANVARGQYLRNWGNTPGHVQHWSKRGLRRFLESCGFDATIATAGLWIVASVEA